MRRAVGKVSNQRRASSTRRSSTGRLQPLLGRAAVDHRQRDAAAPAQRSGLSRPRRLRGDRRQGQPHSVVLDQLGCLRHPRSRSNVRQTPSEANALGELKILFPNKHAIYMHDTPPKNLFKRDEAHSAMAASGCRTRAHGRGGARHHCRLCRGQAEGGPLTREHAEDPVYSPISPPGPTRTARSSISRTSTSGTRASCWRWRRPTPCASPAAELSEGAIKNARARISRTPFAFR